MEQKMISSEEKLTKFDASLVSKKCDNQEDVKATDSNPHQCAKTRRTVKLPRLKLKDLVAQATEENVHKEIPTGPAVGNEIW